MTTDQVERQVIDAVPPTDARHFVASLPVANNPQAQSIIDFIAQERAEKENPVVRMILTGLTWTMYAVALGVVALLIHAMANGYLAH